MADPQIAVATQLRNIESKTGKTFAQLCALIAKSGLSKVSEQRTMLMEELKLGYGDANMLCNRAKEALAPASLSDDPLDLIYTGAKAPLRALHEQLIAAIEKFGPFEKAPKKAYISLRCKKQFAMLGPATKDSVELGLNSKVLQPTSRLKAMPAGGMCQFTVRISNAKEIDAELLAWAREAYDAAK
jgi:hypothetical protein